MRVFRNFALAALTVVPWVAGAQSAGRGFLFSPPRGSISLRAGYAWAATGSDLFAFTTQRLTMDRRAFDSANLDIDLALSVRPRLDLVFSNGYAGMTRPSEFRDFVDQDNQPIRQTTRFQRVPLTINLRQALTSRGRSVGSFAWIPARFTPFVGLGAGAAWYRFLQDGDFVDETTSEIFTGRLTSSGLIPVARGFAGADYSIGPRLALSAQATYLWGRGRLTGDFVGFDRIDLSGTNVNVGIAARF